MQEPPTTELHRRLYRVQPGKGQVLGSVEEPIMSHYGASEDNFALENFLYTNGFFRVAGTDEAGRGTLAGPVVAACVVLPTSCDHFRFVDSKVLTHRSRLELNDHLIEINANIGIGIIYQQKIDEINILQASLLAMKLAVGNMNGPPPDFILVDGKFPIPLPISQKALTKGESKSGSIAAASIVAKVTRDRIMVNLHRQFPIYNFHKNKGYPTLAHRLAIQAHGICPAHRKTFKGAKAHVK